MPVGKTGRSCKLYRNTGTYASPTWSLVDVVKDVSQTSQTTEITADWRARTYEATFPGSIKWALTGTLEHAPGNANHDAILAAHIAGTEMEFLVLNGSVTTTGSSGYRATGRIFQFDENQPLGGTVDSPFKFLPSETREPERYTVA